MARMHKWLGVAALSLTLTGCVSQEKYNAMKLSRDQLAEQVGQADADSKTARAQADAYKAQLDQIAQSGGTKDALLANQAQQIAALTGQLSDIKAKYEDLLSKPPTVVMGSALPAPLTNTLTEFASANPDLVEFDASRGIVKFKSDVTFAPGSAEVTEKARNVIARFATILNSANANGYELMVAGHTDNTPVVNSKTIAAGHKDNWYLSAHRAISVAAELVGQGVSKQRLGVAGYADQRPVAPNTSESGKEKNRRVEVMILPTTVRGSSAGIAGTTPARRSTSAKPKLDKDTGAATTDNRPVLNK